MHDNPSPTHPAPARAARTAQPATTREFLAFRLGGEEYGIDILRVQEIRSYETPTRIAAAPADLLGVINLRGVIVPIVDMRLCFALDEAGYGPHTAVIVLSAADRVIGLVVDSVSDVIDLSAEQINAVPELGRDIGRALLGIGSLDDRMVMLLDIDAAMRGLTLDAVASTTH